MFIWLYDLPNWLLFCLFAITAIAISWVGIFLLRPMMDRLFRAENRDQRNAVIQLVLTGTGLFYVLLAGLIANATALSDRHGLRSPYGWCDTRGEGCSGAAPGPDLDWGAGQDVHQ